MDRCLHLALLEPTYDSALAEEVRALPEQERRSRYPELIAERIPAGVDEARWTDEASLLTALPDGADGTIRNLAGIEGHPNLRVLYLKESEVEDLAPLAALPALELVWLGVTERADLTPLLSCERLRRVNLDDRIRPGTPERGVLDRLVARGVQVDDLLPYAPEAAAPFGDPILKLAVLDELQGSLHLPEMYFFDEYEFDEDNLARLMAVDVSQERLDSIETLSWMGGGHETAHLVWSQWDGESDEFDITSLAGIEALRNLKTLAVSPLKALPDDQVAALRERGVAVTEY